MVRATTDTGSPYYAIFVTPRTASSCSGAAPGRERRAGRHPGTAPLPPRAHADRHELHRGDVDRRQHLDHRSRLGRRDPGLTGSLLTGVAVTSHTRPTVDGRHGHRDADALMAASTQPRPTASPPCACVPPAARRPAPARLAPRTVSRWQVKFALVLVTVLGVAFIVEPLATAIVVNCVVVTFFVAANVMKLALMNSALQNDAVDRGRRPAGAAPREDLPVYTILLPAVPRGRQMVEPAGGRHHLRSTTRGAAST